MMIPKMQICCLSVCLYQWACCLLGYRCLRPSSQLACGHGDLRTCVLTCCYFPACAVLQAEIARLRNAAETIRNLCTDDVRTGVCQCRRHLRCPGCGWLLTSSTHRAGIVCDRLQSIRARQPMFRPSIAAPLTQHPSPTSHARRMHASLACMQASTTCGAATSKSCWPPVQRPWQRGCWTRCVSVEAWAQAYVTCV
jgi:hypothetical protein